MIVPLFLWASESCMQEIFILLHALSEIMACNNNMCKHIVKDVREVKHACYYC